MTPYRYRLVRDAGQLGWLMLNPSVADEVRDDPTIRKCRGFAERNEYDGITVCNVSPFRATDPKALLQAIREGVDVFHQEENDRHLLELLSKKNVIIAPGANISRHPLLGQAMARQIQLLTAAGCQLYHLGLTKDCSFKHPLMLPYSTPLHSMLQG